MSAAPTISATAWTSTADLYVDFDVQMSATTPLANGNKYGSMTCVKFSTIEYICAYLEVEGTGAI